VSYMFDRFHLDLAGVDTFDALVARKLPRDGRHEMRRQLRKFEAGGARAVVQTVPYARLDELTALCHQTTARRGTPQYLPPAPLANLVRSCGDLIRLVVVHDERDRIVGGVICLDDGPVLHVWLGGMTYDGIDFSPYSIGFAEAYRYALAQGKVRVEAGRLNARIKHRLGLVPEPLHAIVSPDLLASTRAGLPSIGAPRATTR
jgi:predicted N-acyltransferase